MGKSMPMSLANWVENRMEEMLVSQEAQPSSRQRCLLPSDDFLRYRNNLGSEFPENRILSPHRLLTCRRTSLSISNNLGAFQVLHGHLE